MLTGLTIVITAGPTWEALDPVRGITNRSSGKMGYAIAEMAALHNAHVILISGPVCLPSPENVTRISIESAQQMYDAVHIQVTMADVFISVAAVADYRPSRVNQQKIKHQGDTLSIELVKTPDIVASVGLLEKDRPFTVGFAAETENIENYARDKLRRKGLDLIAANDVSHPALGFGSDRNDLVLYSKTDRVELGQHSKSALALRLLEEIKSRL